MEEHMAKAIETSRAMANVNAMSMSVYERSNTGGNISKALAYLTLLRFVRPPLLTGLPPEDDDDDGLVPLPLPGLLEPTLADRGRVGGVMDVAKLYQKVPRNTSNVPIKCPRSKRFENR